MTKAWIPKVTADTEERLLIRVILPRVTAWRFEDGLKDQREGLNYTSEMAIFRGSPDEKGWRPLICEADPGHFGEKFPSKSEPLFIFHHLSDLHVCDSQSPLRPEFLDRWSDPDSPIKELVGIIGTYRPQTILTSQVVEAMVIALNKVDRGPLSGHLIDAAIVTGDVTDNAQLNEVGWYLALLDGALIHPDSGDLHRYEGVMDELPDHYDIKYWHPQGTPAGKEEDDPRAKYGYPIVSGLLDLVREPFQATALKFPWFAVHGNHDALLQGTVVPSSATQSAQVAGRRYEGLPSELSLEAALLRFGQIGPASYPDPSDAPYVEVTPDLNRRSVGRVEFAQLHIASTGQPRGHGFDEKNAIEGCLNYSLDVGQVTLVVLDSVNANGGWQGSLDAEQFIWLEETIRQSQRPIILASHHPLSTMINGYSPSGKRYCLEEISAMLLQYPQVILWIAGHEHRHHVEWVGDRSANVGFWHVETASHIDWPQQSRTIEVVKDESGDIYIGMTVIDHAGDLTYEGDGTPGDLAALSRLLSANDWQRRPELNEVDGFLALQGAPEERDVVLKITCR